MSVNLEQPWTDTVKLTDVTEVKLRMTDKTGIQFRCSYSSSITVKSDEFSVTTAAASGVALNDSGSLAAGFALQLYTDKKETTVADATNVVIGFPLYATMKWSLTTVSSVNFFIDNCALSTPTEKIQFIRSNCYSTTLGVQQLQEDKLVPAESKFEFISFIIGGANELEMAATVECTVILCIKGDAACEGKVNTKDDECDTKNAADLPLAAYKYKANTFKQGS